MKNKNTVRKYRSTLITNLLNKVSKTDTLKAHTKMGISARIDDLLQEKGIGKLHFAERLKKKPSVITKWLSGTQNFTVDTLAEIAVELNIQIPELFAQEDNY